MPTAPAAVLAVQRLCSAGGVYSACSVFTACEHPKYLQCLRRCTLFATSTMTRGPRVSEVPSVSALTGVFAASGVSSVSPASTAPRVLRRPRVSASSTVSPGLSTVPCMSRVSVCSVCREYPRRLGYRVFGFKSVNTFSSVNCVLCLYIFQTAFRACVWSASATGLEDLQSVWGVDRVSVSGASQLAGIPRADTMCRVSADCLECLGGGGRLDCLPCLEYRGCPECLHS